MKNNSYKEALNKVKATDSFKAETIIKMENEINYNKKYNFKRIAQVAACLMLLIAGIISYKYLFTSENNKFAFNDPNKLPKISVSNECGGMGFEGYMAYDIDELNDGNPWTIATNLTTMPVFKNPSPADGHGSRYPYLTGDDMLKKAKDIAKDMGLKINKIYTQPTKEEIKGKEEKTGEKEDTTPTDAIAECDGVSIRIDSDGLTVVIFEPSKAIPDKYSFTFENTNSKAKEALDYLIKEYSNIVKMESPAQALFGDYTYEGKRIFKYTAFENKGSLIDKILAYNFNTVSFVPDDNGKLSCIGRVKTDLSRLIGNYPIINAEDARKLLISGHYITTVPEKLPDEKYISKVELIYRNSMYDKVFMPYYKFLVEMPTMQQKNGLKTFGAFYVPAVKGEYLTEMPVWNGEFN